MKKQTKKNKKKTKILCLLSGGLDSILALLLLKQQEKSNNLGIEAVQFISPFFNSEMPEKYAKQFNFKLHKIDLTSNKQYLKMLLHPKNGYGSAINPCIDCHIFMLKQAKKLGEKLSKSTIIATGEVAEERPFSQNMKALRIIEKETKLKGKLLRPLSAKVLEETEAEKSGIINRSKLLAIKGRQRKIQEELAKKFNLRDYPQPAGGCFLCEPHFAERFNQLLKYKNNKKDSLTINDLALLKHGRHFFTKSKNPVWIIVGRNEKDNLGIIKLKEKGDKIIEIKNIPGPTTLIKPLNKKIKVSDADQKKAENLTIKYSAKKRQEYEKIKPEIIEIN